MIEAAQSEWLGLEVCERAKRDTALAHVVLLALIPAEGESFVCHLGGDDFVFIVPANRAATVAG